MSRPAGTTPADSLPPTARAIALLVASTPGVYDAQPGVLHQLLEFSHRYTSQVLVDAQVYSEHAGRSGKIEMDDVTLAVQARVGWEFGGRVPKEVCTDEHLWKRVTSLNALVYPVSPFTSNADKCDTPPSYARGVWRTPAPRL
jgi:transcription initiation factor TFIID subunit 9B